MSFCQTPLEECYHNSSAVPHMEGCKKDPFVRGFDMRIKLWRCTWCYADLNVNESLLAVWRVIGRVAQTNIAPCDAGERGTERRSSILRASCCVTDIQYNAGVCLMLIDEMDSFLVVLDRICNVCLHSPRQDVDKRSTGCIIVPSPPRWIGILSD